MAECQVGYVGAMKNLDWIRTKRIVAQVLRIGQNGYALDVVQQIGLIITNANHVVT